MRHAAVHAEWALKGKASSDRGYRLLNWSKGQLSERNFAQLLDRYSPGVLTELPQVTVSYAKSELRGQYVALAIYHTPPDGRLDPDNRPVLFTSYFCVPYDELAGDAVSYLALYDAFGKVTLPEAAEDQPPRSESRAPLAVSVPAQAPERPGHGDLAPTVAALLLTSRPVCVLGAEQVPMTDRLWFIDRVMSLLPYGLRPRMSATTWASRNYASHKFRLFFSDTPRDADEPDHIATWGGSPPEIPPSYPRARAYLDWLTRDDLPVERLAAYTSVLGFSGTDVDIMSGELGITSAPRQKRHEEDDPSNGPDTPSRLVPGPAASPATEIDRLLSSCNAHLTRGDPHALREVIAGLRECTGYPELVTEERRAVYREKIASCQLFRQAQGLNKQLEMALYNALLRAGFGLPLSYVGYRQLQECLGGQRPHNALLQAILDGGLMITNDGRADDPVVPLLAFSYLDNERALWKWLRSGQVDVRQLLRTLAGDWAEREHASIVLDVTMALIRDLDKKGRLPDLQQTLKDLGFLASAVERRYPGQQEEQVNLFVLLLLAAYGNPLTADDAREVLDAGWGDQPAPGPLFYAVMLMADTRGGNLAEIVAYLMRALIEGSGLSPGMTHDLVARMLDSGPLYRGKPRGTLAIPAPALPAHRAGPSPATAQPLEQPREDDHEEARESQPRATRDRVRAFGKTYPVVPRDHPKDSSRDHPKDSSRDHPKDS